METFEEIVDGVYRICAGRSNIYLLAGDDLTLVDAGMPGEEKNVIDCIDKIGRSLDELGHILITHAHMDHMGSLAALKKASGAEVVASCIEVDYRKGAKKTWTMAREGFAGKLFKGALFFMETFVFDYEPTDVDIPCQGGGDDRELRWHSGDSLTGSFSGQHELLSERQERSHNR